MEDVKQFCKEQIMFQRYKNPDKVGWYGWFECDNQAIAFVGLDGRVVLFDHKTKAVTPLPGEVT